MRKLSREQRRDIAALTAKKGEDIDLSDMPEVLDWSKAEIGKFYRPPKKSVTMRLDADIIEWLKSFGDGYQTRLNLLLRHAMANSQENSRDKMSGRRATRRQRTRSRKAAV
ncbi:MAG TPA: BrnA antitoxin family protein [Candidatus Sulfotelmatobacter sp.]|jgi:uncharacterized protein (DUF4415 family)